MLFCHTLGNLRDQGDNEVSIVKQKIFHGVQQLFQRCKFPEAWTILRLLSILWRKNSCKKFSRKVYPLIFQHLVFWQTVDYLRRPIRKAKKLPWQQESYSAVQSRRSYEFPSFLPPFF